MPSLVRPWVLAPLLLGGCVSSVSTLQTARTLEPGKVELVAGASVPIHGVFVSRMADMLDDAASRAAAGNDDPLNEEERNRTYEAALAAVLLQPAFVPELQGRIGLWDGTDVGLRYAGPAFKLDAKVRLIEQDGFALSASGGYVHHTGIAASIAKSVFEVFETLHLVEYSRRDLDIALLVSGDERRLVAPYGAVRYIVGFPTFDLRLPDEIVESGVVPRTDEANTLHYFGATGGVRIGRSVAFIAELTLMYMRFEPTFLGAQRHLSGMVYAPALGVDVRF
jgi:hypothetical protein